MKYRVINSKDIYFEKRFDGSYHNSDANVYNTVIKHHSLHNLSYYCSEIFTSGRNRRIYTSPEYGAPFLSNSDAASQNPFASCKYSSKKYGIDPAALLKGGMILTGRVGAIGQTTFVPSYWEDYSTMGSDNIIRIIVKPEYKNGFIYAYLASKIGVLSLWKLATGGVQPFITDTMVGTLPIPDVSLEIQNKINDLILESVRLREEAAKSLIEAHSLIDNSFTKVTSKKFGIVNIHSIFQDNSKRADASYHLSEAMLYEKIIRQGNFMNLGSLCSEISGGGRAKRNYTDNVSKGVPYLSNTDLSKANPLRSCKYTLKSKGVDEDEILRKGMIVTGRVGAIGQTQFIGQTYEDMQSLGSDNVIRIVPKANNGYIFSFLSSEIGKSMFWKYAAGGVQPFISSTMVSQILIPILSSDIVNKCNILIEEYSDKIGTSNVKENLAIKMLEDEIDKWNR